MIAPELIRFLSFITHRKRSDIDSRATYLREIGLLTKGGRGPNAPEMTARDAVNLLLAIAVNGPAQSVQHAVPICRSLVNAKGVDFGTFMESQISKEVTVKKISLYRRYNWKINESEPYNWQASEFKVVFLDGTISFFRGEPPEMYKKVSDLTGEYYVILGAALFELSRQLST